MEHELAIFALTRRLEIGTTRRIDRGPNNRFLSLFSGAALALRLVLSS